MKKIPAKQIEIGTTAGTVAAGDDPRFGSGGASTASNVSSTPTTGIAATNVQDALAELDTKKQEKLVSGTTIKTVNGQPLLGSGDITVVGGSGTDLSAIHALTLGVY